MAYKNSRMNEELRRSQSIVFFWTSSTMALGSPGVSHGNRIDDSFNAVRLGDEESGLIPQFRERLIL